MEDFISELSPKNLSKNSIRANNSNISSKISSTDILTGKFVVVHRGTSGGISNDGKQPKIVVWPEWSENDVNNEKWEITSKAKEKDKIKSPQMSQNLFDDPDGRLRLPSSLKVVKWRRASEYFTKIPVVVDSDNGVHDFDIFSPNEHLFVSETLRWIICQISTLWTISAKTVSSDAENQTHDNNFISSSGLYHTWKFWEHIYSLNKIGKGLPQYNPSGKYIVKLFWMGEWRKIFVDDNLPFDENDRLLLPVTSTNNELWPIILTKALLKIASLSYGFSSNETEFGDFSVIHSLTGWIPQMKIITKEYQNQILKNLSDFLPYWTFAEGDKSFISSDKVENAISPENQENVHDKVEMKDSNLKDKKDKKDTKDNKSKDKKEKDKEKEKEKSKPLVIEGKQTFENPETIVFASYKSNLPKLDMLAVSKMADHSEALRKIGLTQTFSHPVSLNYYRDCPLVKPKTPEFIPAWKLIRPMVKPAIPISNDCAIHDIDIFRKEKENVDNLPMIQIHSPFLNYKISNSTFPAIYSKQSKHSIAHIAEDVYEKEPMDVMNDAVNSTEPKEGSEVTQEVDISKKKSTTTKSSPVNQKLLKRSGAVNEDTLNESYDDKECKRTVVADNDAIKSWINLDTFCECFQVLYIYHKPETYRHSETITDNKLGGLFSASFNSNIREPKRSTSANPSNVIKKVKENVASQKNTRETSQNKNLSVIDATNTVLSDTDKQTSMDQKEPIYLFTDNIDSTEILFCLSAFCKWLSPAENPVVDNQTNRNSPSISTLKDTPVPNETNYIESETDNQSSLQLCSFIAENHSWKLFKVGNIFKRARTNGTKAISLKFPPGRHCIRIFMECKYGFHCKVISQNQFHLKNEDSIMPIFTEEPNRLKDLGLHIMLSFNKILENFNNVDERRTHERSFVDLILPPNKSHEMSTMRSRLTQIFGQSFLNAINQLSKDIISQDMIFAIRAVTLFFENNAIVINVQQKQTFSSNRNSAKGVPTASSKLDSRKQSSTKSIVNPDNKDDRKLELYNKEYSEERIIQLQKYFKGLYVRKVLSARDPQSSTHNRVIAELKKLSSVVEQNPLKFGMSILNDIGYKYPQIFQYYGFENDKLNHIALQEFSGTSNSQSGSGFEILFREIFFLNKNKLKIDLIIKLNFSSPRCTLMVINNDNGETYSDNILKRLHLHNMQPNLKGYTILSFVKESEVVINWKLKLICDGNDILPQSSKPELCSDFSVTKIRDYYIPNRHGQLFHQLIKVKNDHPSTIYVKLSNNAVQFRLSIFNYEEEIYSVEGFGEALIPSFIFQKDDISDAGSGRSPSRTSNKSKKTKEKLSPKHSRTNSSCSGDESKANKYSIQVFIDNDAWPLTVSNEEFVDNLRVARKKETMENKTSNESQVKLSPNVDSLKKESAQKVQPKGKGKEKGQDGTKTSKGGEKSGSKAFLGETSTSRPNSNTFESDKAHWVFYLISDASLEDNIQIFKNNEKYENLFATKKLWEKMDSLRFEKGKQIQRRYIEENSVQESNEESSENVTNILRPLNISVFYRHSDSFDDGDIDLKRIKSIEVFRQNQLEWNLWCQNEKLKRNNKIVNNLIEYNKLQEAVNSHRSDYFKARENFRRQNQNSIKNTEMKNN